MEERHQITKLEKNIKTCNIHQHFSIAILSIAIATITFELNMPTKSIFTNIVTILDSLTIPILSFDVLNLIVQKYHLQQKIDELEEQENQVKIR